MVNQAKTKRLVGQAMREVHRNPPSTLDPEKTGAAREAQMRAIALSKAREEGADIPMRRRPRGSGVFTDAEIKRGYRKL